LGPDDDATVSYTVKELLNDIRTTVGRMDGKLDAKADRVFVEQVATKVEKNTADIVALQQQNHDHVQWRETWEKARNAQTEWWKWAVGIGLTLVLVFLATVPFWHK
jgi:hypothetical protein